MPIKSKINSGKRNTLKDDANKKKAADYYRCTKCGMIYSKQNTNFPKCASSLYSGNNGYIPICIPCIGEIYVYYKEKFKDERTALRRMCMITDAYWNETISQGVAAKLGGIDERKQFRLYLQKSYLNPHTGKTYDDTLNEEQQELYTSQARQALDAHKKAQSESQNSQPDSGNSSSNVVEVPSAINKMSLDYKEGQDEPEEIVVTDDMILFWGAGFSPEFYTELSIRYDKWTKDLPKPLAPAEEALYKQICIQELLINKNAAAGRDVEKGQNALNNLLGSLKAKPVQQVTNDDDSTINQTPMGVWISKLEHLRPAIEYDVPEEEAHSFIRYISIWFLGHLCKMLGIKNAYCKLYEEELEKMRIDTPEYDDEEESEDAFYNIFNNYIGTNESSGGEM